MKNFVAVIVCGVAMGLSAPAVGQSLYHVTVEGVFGYASGGGHPTISTGDTFKYTVVFDDSDVVVSTGFVERLYIKSIVSQEFLVNGSLHPISGNVAYVLIGGDADDISCENPACYPPQLAVIPDESGPRLNTISLDHRPWSEGPTPVGYTVELSDLLFFDGTEGRIEFIVRGNTEYDAQSSSTYMVTVGPVSAVCGNGTVESGEECDDGNILDGDCCSSECLFEAADANCEDGVGGTDVDCAGSGICVSIPNDANCDNGLFCDGAETCDATLGCQDGADPCDPALTFCDENLDDCLTPIEITEQMLAAVAQLLDDGVLTGGQANSLSRQIEQAARAIDREKINVACNTLSDFIEHVQDLVAEGVLLIEEAQSLIDQADIIGELLGCESYPESASLKLGTRRLNR